MGLMERIIPKAQEAGKTIVLPEGQDPRVMTAAAAIAREKIAKVVVFATPEEVAESKGDTNFDGLDIEIVNYLESPHREVLAQKFQELRAHKGVNLEQAQEAMNNRLYLGNMMLREGMADGLVAGSIASTADMLRAAFHCVGTQSGIKTASSSFLMELAQPTIAGEEVLIYADCAVNINPTAEQLADIAMGTIATYQALIGGKPKVAFLSFSTKGSAKHALIDKVTAAYNMTVKCVEDADIDAVLEGELQFDSALVPKVAAKKCPKSVLQGDANILIFPDLQAGNIGYKMTERLAGAKALGPILQGLAKPINDLSRGCTADDIVGVAAISACQAAMQQ